jgi:osmotically inducible protein OsmC
MQLSGGLSGAGHKPERLDTRARVTFQPPEGITGIHLTVTGRVPGIDEAAFAAAVADAKANCPVSKALAAVPITVDATLA